MVRHGRRFSTSLETNGGLARGGGSEFRPDAAKAVVDENRRAACFLHVSTGSAGNHRLQQVGAELRAPSKRNRDEQTKGGPFDFAAL